MSCLIYLVGVQDKRCSIFDDLLAVDYVSIPVLRSGGDESTKRVLVHLHMSITEDIFSFGYVSFFAQPLMTRCCSLQGTVAPPPKK
jgi:hypothetical protein